MSIAKAGKRPLRSLTAQEKLEAVNRVTGGGESKASVARDIGVPESTLRGWCKNQAKIFNQARSSPSQLDEMDAGLGAIKRIKLEEPYNLSMKDASDSSYSPSSQFDGEFAKAATDTEPETSPLNLRTPTQALPQATKMNGSVASSAEKEREKNRAELARLSAELGLNRPEVFLSGFGNNASLNDSILFWNLYAQVTYQQQKLLQQQQQQTKFTATTSIDTTPVTTKHVSSNGVSSSGDKRDKILPNTEHQPSVHDSVSYWLRQQSLMGLTNTINNNTSVAMTTSSPNPTTNLPTTVVASTSAMSTSTQDMITTTSTTNNSSFSSMSANSAMNQLRMWNLYQQSLPTMTQLQSLQSAQGKQILYQHLTKEPEKDKQDTENETNKKEEKPRIINNNNHSKKRPVLDVININSSMDRRTTDKHEDEESLDIHQAVNHGEKFLKWLESCGDPSVTAVQIISLQTLIKNVKDNFERKNGDCQRSVDGDQSNKNVRKNRNVSKIVNLSDKSIARESGVV